MPERLQSSHAHLFALSSRRSAFARAGKSVLHLDKNDYYGGDWAAFPLNQFVEWAESRRAGAAGDADGAAEEQAVPVDLVAVAQALAAGRARRSTPKLAGEGADETADAPAPVPAAPAAAAGALSLIHI